MGLPVAEKGARGPEVAVCFSSDAVPVGAQVTDREGTYQGAGRIPGDLTKFRFIDVSLELATKGCMTICSPTARPLDLWERMGGKENA